MSETYNVPVPGNPSAAFSFGPGQVRAALAMLTPDQIRNAFNNPISEPQSLFFLPAPDASHRPEDVAVVVRYYADRAGVEPTSADYARAGYWAAIGRTSDARVMAGGSPVGLEDSPVFARPAPDDSTAQSATTTGDDRG